MGKERSKSDGQRGTLMQSETETRDLPLQPVHPHPSMSSANHSQNPPLEMQDNAAQTSQFFKVEADEMPIEPAPQDGRRNKSHPGDAAGNPRPAVREIAVQTSRPVKEEAEEMSCEPARKRVKSEPLYDRSQSHENAAQASQESLNSSTRNGRQTLLQVEEIPRLAAVKEERKDYFPLSVCRNTGHRNTSVKEEESPHEPNRSQSNRSSLAACSQLVSSIVQGVLVIRKQRRQIKAESEDMAIDPDTDDEQDIEDQLPRLNESLNQLLPAVEENLAEFVKQEQEEVSLEAATQEDQAVSELMDSLSQLVPVLQKQSGEVRAILVKAEDEKMSVDPVADDEEPENGATTSHVVKAEAEERSVERVTHNDVIRQPAVLANREQNAQRTYCLREVCSRLDGAVAQLQQMERRRRERRRIEAEETSMEQNQDVRQTRSERPVLVVSENTARTSQVVEQETPNPPNGSDDSLQMDQAFTSERNEGGPENEVQMSPFVEAEAGQILHDCLRESCQDRRRERLRTEAVETSVKPNQDKWQIVKAKAEQRPLAQIMSDSVDRLRESYNRFMSKCEELTQALRRRQRQDEDRRRERLQTEAGETSNGQNQNGQQRNSQPSVREEGEDPMPVLPDNAHPASQSVTEDPHSPTEPMTQNGYGGILNRSIKREMSESEDELDETQDFSHYLANGRSGLLNRAIKTKMNDSEDESEGEMQNGGQGMTNGRRDLLNQTETNETRETEEQSEDETQNGGQGMTNGRRELLNQNVTIEMSESEEESEDEMPAGSGPLNQIVQNEMGESEERGADEEIRADDLPRRNNRNVSAEAAEQSQNNGFSVTHNETFNCITVKHNLQFSGGTADFGAYHSNIASALERAAKKSLDYAKQEDKIQIELRNAKLQNNVSVILANKNDLSGLNTLFERLGEANSSVQQLEMVVKIVKAPVGGAKRKREDMEDMPREQRQHLYVPRCDDRLSFAISLAYCLNPGVDDSQAANLGEEMQTRVDLNEQIPKLTAEAQRRIGLIRGFPVFLATVRKFEMLLHRKIVVFYRRDNTLSKYMTQVLLMEDPPVYLYLHQNRFYGICDLRAFLDGNYFCERCCQDIGGDVENHNCQKPCPICLSLACVKERPVYCEDCNRHCRSRNCYEAHRKKKNFPNAARNVQHVTPSYCDTEKRCKKCNFVHETLTRVNFRHKCLRPHCSTCDVDFDFAADTHKCYIKPLANVQNNSTAKLVFYEFKTYADESGKRVPFVLSVKTLLGKTWTMHGEQCLVNVLRHFRLNTFHGTTFVSHHTDSSILLDSMIVSGLTPNVVLHNGKIARIELPDCRLTFVDAAMFLPMPLDALPKVFGFNSHKGFFPSGFVSRENLQYVGPCPAPEFYPLETMDEKRRQEFDEAYGSASVREFNFKREAKIYCEDDVGVLTTACVKLRNWFVDCYNVDPFRCATLQSFGMNVFRTKFLPESTLAIPLFDDYKPNRKPRSAAGIEWLEWVMFSEEIFIQHALNKGNKRTTDSLLLDGYSDVDGDKVIWEFLDCKENGCPVCFPGADNRGRNRWCKDRLARLESISDSADVRLVVIREHAWKESKTSEAVVSFLKSYKPPQPLALHDLSFASMDGVAKLQHTAASDERILFAEVDSLFPYVMANNPYPVGHPLLFFEKFVHPQAYFGLIKAVVSPPKDLLFPVLPYKCASGKTAFTLCGTCADSNQQRPCDHSDKERAITGVWVTPEFNKALQMGYELIHIVEVWHFERKSSTIFEEFVSDFVKGKKGSLGSSRKHVYKGSIDEFWRGFGDRSAPLQSQTVSNNADFSTLVFSDERNVEFFEILSDKTALVQWTSNQNARPAPKDTDNVLATAFTAAYGRLHLYSVLEKLQDKVLYYDTDRVVYVAKGEANEPEFGGAPGQLADKLTGDAIREFASVGRKSFAYRTEAKRVVLSVKGVTRTLENCEGANLGVRGRNDGDGRETIKTVYDQRRILPGGNTVPFGHRLDCPPSD